MDRWSCPPKKDSSIHQMSALAICTQKAIEGASLMPTIWRFNQYEVILYSLPSYML